MSGCTPFWNFLSSRAFQRLSLCALAACALPAQANEPASLAGEIAQLRAAIESLSHELELERSSAREELSAAAARSADLEAELQREELRLRRVQQSLAERVAEQQRAAASESSLRPMLRETLEAVRAFVEASLPFQREARLQAIAELQRDLEEGRARPGQVSMRLWSLLQDELRLCRESGLYRQPIRLHETEHLADVARLGMVQLYARTSDGQIAQAQKAGAAWHFVPVAGDEAKAAVRGLFDSFQKQIRVGLFEVPVSVAALATADEGNAP